MKTSLTFRSRKVNSSILDILELLYASFEYQQLASRISNFESNLVKSKNVVLLNAAVVQLIKQEARSKKQEARSKKQEARSKKQEARSKKQEARSKKQEARSKKQEARSKK